jgi:hypothetical protein
MILPGITHWNHPAFFAYFGITGSGPGVSQGASLGRRPNAPPGAPLSNGRKNGRYTVEVWTVAAGYQSVRASRAAQSRCPCAVN